MWILWINFHTLNKLINKLNNDTNQFITEIKLGLISIEKIDDTLLVGQFANSIIDNKL